MMPAAMLPRRQIAFRDVTGSTLSFTLLLTGRTVCFFDPYAFSILPCSLGVLPRRSAHFLLSPANCSTATTVLNPDDLPPLSTVTQPVYLFGWHRSSSRIACSSFPPIQSQTTALSIDGAMDHSIWLLLSLGIYSERGALAN
ncbi:uncharacterized protein LOC112344485 [Selaginella moellendorffii]|uniref:uncharacterized protein LOC112344485 n=1 Tax=Selaginella moellendorffii TaxID=88036 RepID=UPI000D1CC317|nr:uncharacterized protein LOC112344485 [Selaginella moellendorffii]|eukprot:XP_024525136.1 uncharacterized protein LOC112344485 [Selaginella moellendorffii]